MISSPSRSNSANQAPYERHTNEKHEMPDIKPDLRDGVQKQEAMEDDHESSQAFEHRMQDTMEPKENGRYMFPPGLSREVSSMPRAGHLTLIPPARGLSHLHMPLSTAMNQPRDQRQLSSLHLQLPSRLSSFDRVESSTAQNAFLLPSLQREKTLSVSSAMELSPTSKKNVNTYSGALSGAEKLLDAAEAGGSPQSPDEVFVGAEHIAGPIVGPNISRKANGNKKFGCTHCPKTFGSNRDLLRHVRTHTGEKPFGCDLCQRRFTVKGHLTRHLKSHAGSIQKKHKCAMCSKAFCFPSLLKNHERIHTGEKPYECMLCDKRFTQKSNLTKHQRTHLNAHHPCQICFIKFSKKRLLNEHLKKAHGRSPRSKLFTYAVKQQPKSPSSSSSSGFKSSPSSVWSSPHPQNSTLNGSYRCPPCRFTFQDQRSFVEHQRTHKTSTMADPPEQKPFTFRGGA